jgi:hypothetical protein
VLGERPAQGGKLENLDPILEKRSPASSSTTPPSSTSPSSSTTPQRSPTTCAPTSPGSPRPPRRHRQVRLRPPQITRLDRANLLYLVVSKFAEIDLHPDKVSNLEMGYLYEELIRRFSELSNETAGEHFTPREVIRLMVNLLFIEDDDLLHQARHREDDVRPGLRHRRDAVGRRGPSARAEPAGPPEVFGQELNAETYAICRSDMMLKGQDASNIVLRQQLLRGRPRRGRTSTTCSPTRRSGSSGRRSRRVKDEHDTGFAGRFGAGLPRINDGSFLFLQHMISKMKPVERAAPGSRSSSTARRCSPAPPARASPRSAGGSSRTTGSKPSSPCPTSSSTTPASRPTSGSSPTARAPSGAARSSSSTPASCSPRCARASGRSASRSATTRSPRSPASTASSRRTTGSRSFPNESFGFLRITVERSSPGSAAWSNYSRPGIRCGFAVVSVSCQLRICR